MQDILCSPKNRIHCKKFEKLVLRSLFLGCIIEWCLASSSCWISSCGVRGAVLPFPFPPSLLCWPCGLESPYPLHLSVHTLAIRRGLVSDIFLLQTSIYFDNKLYAISPNKQVKGMLKLWKCSPIQNNRIIKIWSAQDLLYHVVDCWAIPCYDCSLTANWASCPNKPDSSPDSGPIVLHQASAGNPYGWSFAIRMHFHPALFHS